MITLKVDKSEVKFLSEICYKIYSDKLFNVRIQIPAVIEEQDYNINFTEGNLSYLLHVIGRQNLGCMLSYPFMKQIKKIYNKLNENNLWKTIQII